MSRWFWFTICAAQGLILLVCGWLVPEHLCAVDASVLRQAGRNTPGLIRQGWQFLNEGNVGAALFLSKAAEMEDLPGRDVLHSTLTNITARFPRLLIFGYPAPQLEHLGEPADPKAKPDNFTDWCLAAKHRAAILDFLGKSSNPGVQELMRFRDRTNTVIFSPSASAAGQALDTAICDLGLLLEKGRLTPGLSNKVVALATQANGGGKTRPLEQSLLDCLSLGERFNWGQITAFTSQIRHTESLRLLAEEVRRAGARLPILFSVVELSGKPDAVAHYLMNFSKTGLKDAGATLRYGKGGLETLLKRNQRLYSSRLRQWLSEFNPFGAFFYFALGYCLNLPWLALGAKWILYIIGGFLIATAMHPPRPEPSPFDDILRVGGFDWARESLFALGFLLVVLLLSEPFLAQNSQKMNLPIRLRVPTAGAVVRAGTPSAPFSSMNQANFLIMALFLVLQGLLYTACIVKLREIRRQRVLPRIKLKLLENEDHLFDAGLYLGFLGTIISFVLYSLNVMHQFSLMVAYSSTSFGILFVSFFKICHLRPARRRLLLEAETNTPATMERSGATTFAAP